MANQQLSVTPSDPYAWHESVLSTRSLSYLSTVDGAIAIPLHLHPNSSHSRPPSLMDEGSEYDLEMAPARGRAAQEYETLPGSVAQSQLFTLPREIRDRIYSFCLVAPNELLVHWPGLSSPRPALSPQLLRTCKIIYSEAAPIAYTANTFAFSHPSDANIFVRAVSSPQYSRAITSVHLHVRAQDTRLWMPYLTSTDQSRSLRHDLLHLRELTVRYISNKWQHALPIDTNMRHWSEDRHLDEVMDGLRHVFFPPPPKTLLVDGREIPTADVLRGFVGSDPDAPDPGHDADRQSRVQELYRLKTEFATMRARAPAVKVICTCRVHHTHFSALTSTAPMALPAPPVAAPPQPQAQAQPPNNHPVLLPLPPPLGPIFVPGIFQGHPHQQQPQPATPPPPPAPPLAPPAGPVKKGEPFRGFTASDLRGRVKRRVEGDGSSGSMAHVARTVFANKKNVLLALEVFMIEHVTTDGR